MTNTKFPRKRTGKRSVKPDSNTLSKLYENHTMAEIAEMYGVSRSTVNFWIWKYRKEEEAAAEAAEQETVQEDV